METRVRHFRIPDNEYALFRAAAAKADGVSSAPDLANLTAWVRRTLRRAALEQLEGRPSTEEPDR